MDRIRVREPRAIPCDPCSPPSRSPLLLGASAAQAEKRIFIIANNADGYGVDRCLASGAACGAAAATAYCKSREFAQAASFRKVDRDEITGAVPTNGGRPAAAAAARNSSPSSARAKAPIAIAVAGSRLHVADAHAELMPQRPARRLIEFAAAST